MAVLGVIILIVVAVVAVTVIGKGGDPVALELPGFDIDTSASGVFGVGAASSLLGVLGVVLLIGGARRGNRRRKEVKGLRREADHGTGSSDQDARAGHHERAGSAPPAAAAAGAGDPGPTTRRGRAGRRGRRQHDDGDGEQFSSVPRD